MSHQFKLRVYYEDTDAGGVVYHANYLSFFSRARTEHTRAAGYQPEKLAQQGYVFPVTSVKIDYLRPAVLDDELVVFSEIAICKRLSITYRQYVVKVGKPEQVLCRAETKVGCVNTKTFRPAPIPAELLAKLTA